MARLAACILALFALWTGLVAAAGSDCDDRQQKPHDAKPADATQPRDRWKWWLYDRGELGITDKQSAEIDKIFEATMPGQRAKREELERMEAALATLVNENKADVTIVAAQVEKVELLRAELNKTRTVMLYRINRLLNADQRVKLEALRARREAERHKQPDSARRR